MGTSAWGNRKRKGTQAPWSRPRRPSVRTGSPATSRAATTSCAPWGDPRAGYWIASRAGSNPPKSWMVSSWLAVPTVATSVSQWGLMTSTARAGANGSAKATSDAPATPGRRATIGEPWVTNRTEGAAEDSMVAIRVGRSAPDLPPRALGLGCRGAPLEMAAVAEGSVLAQAAGAEGMGAGRQGEGGGMRGVGHDAEGVGWGSGGTAACAHLGSNPFPAQSLNFRINCPTYGSI